MGIRQVDGGDWMADYHCRAARVRKVFPTKTEARAWLDEQRVAHRRGENVKRATVTVEQLYGKWLDNLRGKKARSYVRRLETAWKAVKPWLDGHGHRRAASLSVKVLRQYESWREKSGRARSTITNELRLLTGCLRWSASNGDVGANPVRDFRPERGGTAVIPDVPSPDDLQKIFDALPTVATKKAFYALLALGCRVGSFCELMCEDTGVDGQIAFKREVKAGWQYRRPLPAFPFRLPERGVLFPDDRGVKWNHSTLFHRIVKACGVAKVERINVHSLRHCFATYHLAAGESSFDVMRYGGWRTLAMMTKYADQGREYGGLIARGRAEGRADGYLPLWPVGGDEAIKDDEKEDED